MRKFHILLVDDDELALLGLEKGIDWDELEIGKLYKSHSKDTAIRMVKTYPIDIIISDIEMPNGNGIELIRWIKTNKPDVKCIFYTGHADFSYAQEALRLGVEDYLLKPVPYIKMAKIIKDVEEKILKLERTVDLSELVVDLTDHEEEEITDRVKKIIAENMTVGSLHRDEIAAMVHVSPGYLGRMFKKETGVALTDYITQKRIALSKQLLVKTCLSITDITTKIGMSYSSYFSKVFKEQVGMTPQEYRQQHK